MLQASLFAGYGKMYLRGRGGERNQNMYKMRKDMWGVQKRKGRKQRIERRNEAK